MKREAELHRRYLNRVIHGNFKDYYEHNGDDEVIFKFDYNSFIKDKCFYYMRNIGTTVKSILYSGTENPLSRVRLMIQPTVDVNGEPRKGM